MQRLLSAILILSTLLFTTACADLSNADFYETFGEITAVTEAEATAPQTVSVADSSMSEAQAETAYDGAEASVETEPAGESEENITAAEEAPQEEIYPEADKADTADVQEEAGEPINAPSDGEDLVWIPTNGGTKHHMTSTCSKMKDPIQVTKSEALARGFEACKRCYN